MVAMSEPLLHVEGLAVDFPTLSGRLSVVEGVDLHVHRGETLGVVGESGSGKSMTARAILRLVPPPGRIAGGRITLADGRAKDGRVDITAMDEDGAAIRRVRGNRIAMIFQEPMTSFSPVHTIGSQIMESIRLHRGGRKHDQRRLATQLLDRVGIPDPRVRLDAYPFQLSGGMRQRAMIAMALASEPDVLIADEPTTALDVTIQAQILTLLKDLQAETGMAILLITHNLGVVAQVCDRVSVMYMGRMVESGPTADVLRAPLHPYTRGLLASVPLLGARRGASLVPIPGAVPAPGEIVSGCPFHPRCRDMRPGLCDRGPVPAATWVDAARMARCVLVETPAHPAVIEGRA